MTKYLFIVAAVLLVACTSPESTRTQGGGPGADVGNRNAPVLMHEGSLPYYATPKLIGADPPPIDSARDADRLSRES